MAMKLKEKKSSAHALHIYVGYGERGAQKELAIRKAVAATGQKISTVVLSLLKTKYPNIGL